LENHFAKKTQETAEPCQFSPAEPVDYNRFSMKRNLHAGIRLSGGLSLNVLTDDEVNEIHLGTLEVLDKTGITKGDIN